MTPAEVADSTSSPHQEQQRRLLGHLYCCPPAHTQMKELLGRHGSDSLCRDERENKMAATYNVLAFKR